MIPLKWRGQRRLNSQRNTDENGIIIFDSCASWYNVPDKMLSEVFFHDVINKWNKKFSQQEKLFSKKIVKT